MAELQVELVAVERKIWSGEAAMVIARTTEGELGVLPGHAPLLGELAEGGTVRVRRPTAARCVAAVHGGFLSVTDEGVADPGRDRRDRRARSTSSGPARRCAGPRYRRRRRGAAARRAAVPAARRRPGRLSLAAASGRRRGAVTPSAVLVLEVVAVLLLRSPCR